MLLYAHFPYCLHKCPYCDFNTYAVNSVPERAYMDALLAELTARAQQDGWRGQRVDQVFLGGGTPSLFDPSLIAELLTQAFSYFPPNGNPEITLEANPGSLERDRLAAFLRAGINRLSLGAQSFSPTLLKTLGRTHVPEDVRLAVESARAVGLTNISVDLMYGIPGQRIEDVRSDLEHAARLGVNHISAYCLTFEQGTPFFRARAQGKLTALSDDDQLEMMDTVNERLTELGYQRYEISNFCRTGFASQHNLGYWQSATYLGLGAGAHGCMNRYDANGVQTGALRYANIAKPEEFISGVKTKGSAEAWSETLSWEQCIYERFFLGLRLREGISLIQESERFGVALPKIVMPALTELVQRDLLQVTAEDRVALTARGFELADSIFESLLEITDLLTPFAPESARATK